MTPYERSIARLFRDAVHYHCALTQKAWLAVGYETVKPGMPYDWDGLKRVGRNEQPVWLLQFTFEGWGWLEARGRRRRVPTGSAFSVKIPSRHRYQADPACPEWRFCWMLVKQPYVSERLLKQTAFDNRVVRFAHESGGPLASLRQLLEAACEAKADPYRLESQLFAMVLELERWAFFSRHPGAKRDTLLDSLRPTAESGSPVRDVARQFGMSRTHFSHYFRRTTGESPAAFLRRERLKQAEKLLVTSSLSVKEIAATAGFTSSNHLCKAFRAYYQLSPGDYRRMAPSSQRSEVS